MSPPLGGVRERRARDGCKSEALSVPGLFETHGAAVVPTVTVMAPEKLSASTKRRYETQVHVRVQGFLRSATQEGNWKGK